MLAQTGTHGCQREVDRRIGAENAKNAEIFFHLTRQLVCLRKQEDTEGKTAELLKGLKAELCRGRRDYGMSSPVPYDTGYILLDNYKEEAHWS